ncbi:hypothetical protein D3C80_1792560 [compost metagenome]
MAGTEISSSTGQANTGGCEPSQLCSPLQPRPLTSSRAKAWYSAAGSKVASAPVRPRLTLALRRSVMSRVETAPDTQAVPGSTPI